MTRKKEEIAVPYLRVSTDKQDETYQIQYIEQFIKEQGWAQGSTYRDSGISAYKENIKREDFDRMIDDAKKRKFKHIVVYDLDRFSRKKPQEVLDLIKKLRLMYDVEVNAVFGDEWRDLVNFVNNIPNMGFLAEPLCDFLENVIIGIKAYESHNFSKKLSENVLNSKRFQKAKEEGRVGRSKKDVDVEKIIELKNQGLSFGEIAEKMSLTKATIYRRFKNHSEKN